MKINKEIFKNIIELIRAVDKSARQLNKILDCEINKFTNPIDNLLYNIEKSEGYKWPDDIYTWIYDEQITPSELYDKMTEYQDK